MEVRKLFSIFTLIHVYTHTDMFILRTVFTYGLGSEVKETTNKVLGDVYMVYYENSDYFKAKLHTANVFAILYTPEKEIELLYDTPYYVMTCDGQTFEKLFRSREAGMSFESL